VKENMTLIDCLIGDNCKIENISGEKTLEGETLGELDNQAEVIRKNSQMIE